MTQLTHRDFFVDFLDGLKLPSTTSQLRTLAAVSIFESSQGDLHWWNPLAVSTPCPGSKPLYPHYKGACAQIYPSYPDGLSESVHLFLGPHWNGVRTALGKRWSWRGPMLDAFSAAYTWAKVDFRTVATVTQLDARLKHPLYGP